MINFMSILVVGGGSWGTALATLLCQNCEKVLIFSKNSEIVNGINVRNINCKYLEEFSLAKNIIAVDNFSDLNWNEIELIFFALPSHVFCEICDEIPAIAKKIPLVICSKGLEINSLNFVHALAKEKFNFRELAILSGPNFSEEIAKKLPSCTDIATKNYDLYQKIAKKIGTFYFKNFYNNCLISTQIGGIIKNVAAIACGLVIGAALGNNLRSIIISQAFQEMKILCENLDGNIESLNGHSGLADLCLTCTSLLSRNMKFGHEIGKNGKIPEKMAKPEGYFSAKALHLFCKKQKIELKMCETVFQIIYNNDKNEISKQLFQIF